MDLGELNHVLKAVAIVTGEPKCIDDFCGQSLIDCWGVPWMEVKPRFWDPEKVSLSPENVNIFPRCMCPLNGGIPWIEVSQRRMFHCIKLFPSPFCNRFFFLYMTLTPYASNFFLFFVFCRIVICGSTIAYHFPTPQFLRLVSHNSSIFFTGFPNSLPVNGWLPSARRVDRNSDCVFKT